MHDAQKIWSRMRIRKGTQTIPNLHCAVKSYYNSEDTVVKNVKVLVLLQTLFMMLFWLSLL